MKIILSVTLLSLFSMLALSQDSEIVVNVSGFKSDKGKGLVYVYNNKKGFPVKADLAIKTLTGKIINGKSAIVLKDMPSGEYAISVVHDENDNGKLETNFLGIPREGVGASNNPKSTLGPPKYEDAVFQLKNSSITLNITLRYL